MKAYFICYFKVTENLYLILIKFIPYPILLIDGNGDIIGLDIWGLKK